MRIFIIAGSIIGGAIVVCVCVPICICLFWKMYGKSSQQKAREAEQALMGFEIATLRGILSAPASDTSQKRLPEWQLQESLNILNGIINPRTNGLSLSVPIAEDPIAEDGSARTVAKKLIRAMERIRSTTVVNKPEDDIWLEKRLADSIQRKESIVFRISQKRGAEETPPCNILHSRLFASRCLVLRQLTERLPIGHSHLQSQNTRRAAIATPFFRSCPFLRMLQRLPLSMICCRAASRPRAVRQPLLRGGEQTCTSCHRSAF